MGKIFRIEATATTRAGKTLKEALQQAEQTGVLLVPAGELCLHLPTEIKMEGQTDGRR